MEKDNLTIICLDSDDDDVVEIKEIIDVISSDDEFDVVHPPTIRSSDFKQTIVAPSIRHSQSPNIKQIVELQRNQKRLSNDVVDDTQKGVKQLKSESDAEDFENGLLTPIREPTPCYDDLQNDNQNAIDDKQQLSRTTNIVEKPMALSYAKFINACRQADPTFDMEDVITNKLLKYYYMADSNLRNSESFQRTIISMTEEIQSNKKQVYLKVSKVLQELDLIQKKIIPTDVPYQGGVSTIQTDVTYQGAASTDDERKENHVKLLYDTFNELQNKIYELDATDVDLINDENHSSEMQSLYVQYKKRACKVYKEICKLTGGMVKKRIKFNGTKYPEFNKQLQRLVNRTDEFPDVADVVRIFKRTAMKCQLKLDEREIETISQDAFISIGKTLQKRRKRGLDDTISYYATENDPAYTDPNLQAMLEHNRKHHSRINDVINRVNVQKIETMVPQPSHDDDDLNDIIQNDKDDDNEMTITEIISDLED